MGRLWALHGSPEVLPPFFFFSPKYLKFSLRLDKLISRTKGFVVPEVAKVVRSELCCVKNVKQVDHSISP